MGVDEEVARKVQERILGDGVALLYIRGEDPIEVPIHGYVGHYTATRSITIDRIETSVGGSTAFRAQVVAMIPGDTLAVTHQKRTDGA